MKKRNLLSLITSMAVEGAKDWLECMDTDLNGVVDKNEYMKAEHDFWYKSKKKLRKSLSRSISSLETEIN